MPNQPDSDNFGEPQPWRTLARELRYDASPWVRHFTETLELPNGHVVDDFHTIEAADYAAIFALTDDGQVVCERQYRHGAGEVCTVLPAGIVEPGEDHEAAARRELQEETGYTARTWRHLGSYVVDGNRGIGRMHAYLATGAKLSATQHLDDLENITVLLLPLDTMAAMLSRNEFRTLSSAAIVGLALAALRE